MLQSIVRYIIAAGSGFLAGKGVITEGQDLGSLTIEQAVILFATIGATALWSFLQKKFFAKKAE